MGLNIHFCDICAARVTDQDLRSGHGIRRGFDVICAPCLELGHGRLWLAEREHRALTPGQPQPSGLLQPPGPLAAASDPDRFRPQTDRLAVIPDAEPDQDLTPEFRPRPKDTDPLGVELGPITVPDGLDAGTVVEPLTNVVRRPPADDLPEPGPVGSGSRGAGEASSLAGAAMGMSALMTYSDVPISIDLTEDASVAQETRSQTRRTHGPRPPGDSGSMPSGGHRVGSGSRAGMSSRGSGGRGAVSGNHPQLKAPLPAPIKMMFVTVPLLGLAIIAILLFKPAEVVAEPEVIPTIKPKPQPTSTTQLKPITQRDSSKPARDTVLTAMKQTQDLAIEALKSEDLAKIEAARARFKQLDQEIITFKRAVMGLGAEAWSQDESERYLEAHSLPEVRAMITDLNQAFSRLSGGK